MSQFIEMFGTVENNTHNFPIMTIGEFANCFAGATPSTSHPEYWENGRIRWMSSGEVHKGHVEDTDSRITELGYKSASTRMVPIHSIVIAIAGQGKTRGTVAITEVDLCTNQSLCAIVPDERVNYSYLYHNLQGRYLELRGLSGDVNGRGGLNLKIIQKIPVILPPIEKQQQFASIAQQADKSKFGDFKSQFIEMFGNPVTNTKGWKTAKIKDVAPEMPSKEQLSGKIWLLNLDMIESNTGRIIEKVYEDVENALSVQSFDEGNVLFSKLRPYLNKVVIPDEPGMATTELVPLRPEPSKLHKVFLSHLLRGNQFVNYANDIAGGTKMPRMPLTELRNFDCILPPMDKQLEFVFIAEQVDKSKSVIQKALVYLNDIQSDELGKIA